nr:PH-interacting protein [Tanacetum cinerariifolium]
MFTIVASQEEQCIGYGGQSHVYNFAPNLCKNNACAQWCLDQTPPKGVHPRNNSKATPSRPQRAAARNGKKLASEESEDFDEHDDDVSAESSSEESYIDDDESFIEEDEESVVVKPSESQSSLEETKNSVALPASTRKLVLKFSAPKKEPTSQNTPTRVKVEEESARPVSENPIGKSTTNGHKSTKIRFKPNVKLEHDVKPVDGQLGKTSWLLLSQQDESCRYIPQLGDQVIYLRQGHQEYIESRNSQERGPWMKYKEKIKDAEICLVDDIKYKTLPGSGESCCKIRLIFIDPLSKVSGKHLELTLPELVDDPDFLVEKTRYDSSLERVVDCR